MSSVRGVITLKFDYLDKNDILMSAENCLMQFLNPFPFGMDLLLELTSYFFLQDLAKKTETNISN